MSSFKSPQAPSVTPSPHGEGERHRHEAFGVLTMTTIQGGDGEKLFGSDLPHRQRIRISLHRAVLDRSLHRDWAHDEKMIACVEMSHAQFAQFITSNGSGAGTPCTIRYAPADGASIEEMAPIAPLETKHETLRREIKESAAQDIQKVSDALAALEEMASNGKVSLKTLKEKLHSARCHLTNLPSNLSYAVKSAEEALEKATSDARIEIESYVQMTANRLGLQSISELARIEEKHVKEEYTGVEYTGVEYTKAGDEAQAIVAGMHFILDGVAMEVVKPNPKIPGNWFCRSTQANTGLWSYDPRDILNNLVS